MSSPEIEQIKSKLDILQVVQEYVPQMKASGRNYFGLCPFHSESSPSFSVNPELGVFKCFGCGEGGDVITFLEKIEGLDFREALELSAEKAGVELKKTNSKQAKAWKRKKDRALEAHKFAARYYQYLLLNHPSGKECLNYVLEKRKLTHEMIEEYSLGYAPKGYHNLEKFLMKHGFKRQELIEYGLLASKNGRVYDKFRERLMHPIFNLRGDVIGFSGRIIDAESKAPKYLNSPETIVYHKSEELYGAYQAKDSMIRERKAILVEGNIDVVSSSKVGVANIVCPLGTALTEEQLKLLKRYVEQIQFAFDTDNAGKKALLRSLELTEKVGLDAMTINLGDYKDADDMIKDNPEAWKDAIANAQEIPEFIIQIFKSDFDLSSSSQKVKYIELILPFLVKLKNDIKLDHYLQRLVDITEIRYQTLEKMLQDHRHNNSVKQKLLSDENVKEQKSEPKESKPRYSQEFIKIVNQIYFYSDQIADKSKFQELYVGKLPKYEEEILNMLLESKQNKEDAEPNAELSQILAQDLKPAFDKVAGLESELFKMLKRYVLGKLRDSLKALQKQLSFTEEDKKEEILKRISLYAGEIRNLG